MADQNGWIRKRHRKSGDIWVYCHRRRRWDGKWVEATERRLGTIHELPDEEAAWKRLPVPQLTISELRILLLTLLSELDADRPASYQ